MPKSNCKVCGKEFIYHKSNKSGLYCSSKCSFACLEWRKKQSLSKTGKKHSQESRDKMSKSRIGKKHSKEWCINKGKSLTKYYDRIGRITDIIKSIRLSEENIEWRNSVFKRDEYKCINCGSNDKIQADHIIPLGVLFREHQINNNIDLFDIENGRTLCYNCHKKTSSFAVHTNKTIEGKLFFIIKKIHEQSNSELEFEMFYKTEMNKIIEHFKSKLD